MIDNLFAYFENIDSLNSLYLSANEDNTKSYLGTDTSVLYNHVPDISYETMVVVSHPKLIVWTHGTMIDSMPSSLTLARIKVNNEFHICLRSHYPLTNIRLKLLRRVKQNRKRSSDESRYKYKGWSAAWNPKHIPLVLEPMPDFSTPDVFTYKMKITIDDETQYLHNFIDSNMGDGFQSFAIGVWEGYETWASTPLLRFKAIKNDDNFGIRL